MKKIRINELARELEVKPGVILDLLPELGVQEKKTHSSSIDEDVAIELRNRLVGSGGMHSEYSNGHPHDREDDNHTTEPGHDEHHVSSPESTTAVAEEEETPPARAVQAEPARPPAGSSFQPPLRPPVRPPQGAHQPPAMPIPPAAHAAAIPIPPAHAAQAPGAPVTEAPAAPAPPHPVEERPAPRFQPLRPPLGSGFHGPVAPHATPAPAPGPPTQAPSPAPQGAASPAPPNRNLTLPSRPSPMTPRAPSGSAPPIGPRQPLPPEAMRPPLGSPQRATRPPGGQGGYPPPSARPTVPSAAPQVPTHIIAPGPASAGPATPSASAVPGAPIPPRPPTPKPNQPNLRPGAPIAPRPQSTRPVLAGQPAARPVVPPRPDLVARLQQTQARPSPAAPAAPRPGTPTRPSSPTPGQPIYRGPVRPGQPTMRGPGMPGPAGPAGPLQRRPGSRPMHPTTPLRAEPSTPLPTEQQRRHQAKPGARLGPRKREDEEGNLRLRTSKRSAVLEPPPIDREITVAEGVTVKELSEKLGVKANLVIKKLVERKIFATINQTLDVKLAEELARDFGASTNQVSYEEESIQDIELAEENKDLVRRAPVVTIMGHVDHGKTSLLDAIRQTNVAGREAGGITQHIGAYYIEKNGRKIVFIDTPGHQAFTRMRARGAKVTDIVVLVVSADDGVMPQTLEAISHAKAAGVPLLVAINKIDKPDAQPDRVKQQLSDRGLLAEDWGGDVVMVPVSAKTGQNLDLLLEMILLVADLQDLKANPNRPALGTVLEAQLDRGRGPVATMLVRNGTLRIGDFFICGALFSKVRAMFDDRGNAVKEAEPSMPVEVIGLDSLPEVGDSFQVVSDTSKAKQIVIYREAKARDLAMAKGARVATLDSLHRQFKEGDLKDLNLIIKADVGGTAEVLSDTLQQLSTDKVRVRVLHAGVGTITETDVLLASASEAIIIGFNTKPDRNAQAVAEQQKVTIRLHSIIYELIDETKLAMNGLLDPVYKETIQGHAEVKEIFKISKVGTVAGCFVSDGTIRRDSQIRVMRGRDLIHTGKIQALKRFKNDASEVKNGLECGISIANFNSINVGDVFEAFTMERIAPELPTAS
ncbi:MAG TPA: translation initiation factor IF-2 [Bryobacteraceae bacterium]|nr:translation initiation factor IF-2 [Bryobacteraceae bacterium]